MSWNQLRSGSNSSGSPGFSGAEIEAALQSALYAAFARKQELSTEDLLTALSSTVPLSITRAEEIATLRDWAKERAVWASAPQPIGKQHASGA